MTARIRRAAFLGALTLGLVALAAGCDDQLVKDPTFRTWCGDSLCAWTVETGLVRQAPTWHEQDRGVELVTTPTVMSQRARATAPCIEFSVVADVDPRAQVFLAMDFNDDGTLDHRFPVAAARFTRVATLVRSPELYAGLRFVVEKVGVGRAVLAELSVRSRPPSDCTGPAVVLDDLPLGAPCSVESGAATCGSGVCCAMRCSECCPGRDDEGGFDPGPERGCTVKARDGGAGVCAIRDGETNTVARLFDPWQCNPGAGTHAAGAECVRDDDCRSGVCEGARRVPVASPLGEADAGDCNPESGEGCPPTRAFGGRCR